MIRLSLGRQRTFLLMSRETTVLSKANMSSEARTSELVENLSAIQNRISSAQSSTSKSTLSSSSSSSPSSVVLVAVSKLKPASDVAALYHAANHRHFGENYVQELVGKAKELPDDIRWHFIGALQSNKCAPLASSVRNLYAVETVDSCKKATGLQKGRTALRESLGLSSSSSDSRDGDGKTEEELMRVKVFIQINTSGESEKSGLPADEEGQGQVLALMRHVLEHCPDLELYGLMTIGALATSRDHHRGGGGGGGDNDDGGNVDFETLKRVRRAVEGRIEGLPTLKLSMGMSEDFEDAVRQGSDEVRVGSRIFGARPPKQSKAVEKETARPQS